MVLPHKFLVLYLFRLSHKGLVQRTYVVGLTSSYKQYTCSINNGSMPLCFLFLHYSFRHTWNKGTCYCWVLSHCNLFDSLLNGPTAFKWRAYLAFGKFSCFQGWELVCKLQSQHLTVITLIQNRFCIFQYSQSIWLSDIISMNSSESIFWHFFVSD